MIDCTTQLVDLSGEPIYDEIVNGKDESGQPIVEKRPVRLGNYIARCLSGYKAKEDEDSTGGFRIIAVGSRMAKGGKRVDLAAEDITLCVNAVKKTARVDWLPPMVQYLMDRPSVKDPEALAALDELYKNGKKGK